MPGAPIRYATTRDGIEIAYRVLGDGPLDIVFVNGFSSPASSAARARRGPCPHR